MEPARKRIKLEEGEPSFSVNQCVVVEAHIKEEQLSDGGDSSSEDTGSEGSDSEGSEEYQSCESGAEEEIKSEPQAAQSSSHEPSASEANTHYKQICFACDEGFPDKQAYQKHRKTHPNPAISCLGCEKCYPSFSKMMEHLENGTCKSGCTPRLVESVVATHCEGLHPSSSLNIHLRCPTCKRKYARMSPLFRHLENRSCALRDWINETGLLDLLTALHEAIEKKKSSTFQCNICRKAFGKESAMMQHQRDKHERTYCWACQTNFGSPEKKQKHVMTGTSAKSGTFICNSCDPKVPFGIEKEYCDHMWLEHLTCGPCGRVFVSAELRKQHDAELHHRCGVCYRFFKSAEELTEHRETHVVKPPVVEPPVQIPPPVNREPTPPPRPLSPIIIELNIPKQTPVERAAPVAEERVPVKTEAIPVRRVTPTTRPVIFSPYPPRPTPVPMPENKKTQSLITGFLIRKS
ncbi:zinc finger and BTB domain protein [Fusarium sp. NRRL 25303]|nr:zinc finger and BTB domain protein [Fusarium sp. NRRL 25303]